MAVLALYLIRHGIAAERGPRYPDDTKRPLTKKGVAALEEEARALEALGVTFDVIVTSPLVRTRQTADVFADLSKGDPAIVESDALAPDGTPAAVIREIAAHKRKDTIALVGHEPNLGELAATLIGAATPLEFKKGGICRIDVEGTLPRDPGRLRWFVPPRILKQIRE